MTDERSWLPTDCSGWAVRDLVFHCLCDAQRGLVALHARADGEPDRDAVMYWTESPARAHLAAAVAPPSPVPVRRAFAHLRRQSHLADPHPDRYAGHFIDPPLPCLRRRQHWTGRVVHALTCSMQRSATFSKCGRYRYALTRRWGTGPAVTWVMLNPSTADAAHDDATVRRVTVYSSAWGFGALTVVNLYAFRATDPGDLFRSADPIGPDNDGHITQAATGRDLILAWGAHARPERIAAAVRLLTDAPGAGRTHALALTAAGQPRHPLYLPARLTPVPCHPIACQPGSQRPPCSFGLAAPSHAIGAAPC